MPGRAPFFRISPASPAHVRELLVAAIPRADARLGLSSLRLPAVVDHRERPIRTRRREFDDVLGVGEDGGGAVLAVRPVPVVAAVDGLRRHPGGRAHLPAERVDGREGRLARATRRDTTSHTFSTRAPSSTPDAAAAHVRPQADALRIGLPEAERVRARAHAVRVRHAPVGRREVPGHDAVGNEAAPFEVSVAALPRIAERSGGRRPVGRSSADVDVLRPWTVTTTARAARRQPPRS